MSSIRVYRDPVPTIDTPQMMEVDRLMVEEYHIELVQMIENAGRCLAVLARERFLDSRPSGKKVVALAGTGGNGAGVMACARRLHNWGADVEVFVSAGTEGSSAPSGQQLRILERMGIPVKSGEELGSTKGLELIIDGILGYSLSGPPHSPAKEMIEWANRAPAPTLSLDTPSGLDLNSGTLHEPTVKARATLTLALPKKGLYTEGVLPFRGELYLGDISVPPALYAEPSLGISIANLFAESDLLRID